MLFTGALFCIVFLVTYRGARAQIVTLSNTDVALTATPTNFIAGTTKTLEIKCSIPKSNIDEKGIFSVFIINHSEKNGPYKTIASYSTTETRNEKGDHMTVSGVIEKNTESFIKLILKDPLSTDAGSYQCVVNGVTHQGPHATMIRDITVSLDNGDNLPTECRTRIKDLEETIARLENSCSPVNFVKKGLSGNSYYYLSSPNSSVDVEIASQQCQLKGGYLVEIDTSSEYDYLVKFLTGETSYYSVLAGGSDTAKERDWVYTRSGRRPNGIQWGHLQPDGGTSVNCLHFWSEANWKMSDEPCVMEHDTHKFGFICEVQFGKKK